MKRSLFLAALISFCMPTTKISVARAAGGAKAVADLKTELMKAEESRNEAFSHDVACEKRPGL